MQKYSCDLWWELGLIFLLDPTLNAGPKLQLHKGLPCRHPCHTWDCGLGTLCEVVSPNFHALNGWDCMDWTQVAKDLGVGAPCEPALKFILIALTYTRPSRFEEFARTKTIHSTPHLQNTSPNSLTNLDPKQQPIHSYISSISKLGDLHPRYSL